MKKMVLIMLVFFLQLSCKKDAPETIYGEYFQDGPQTGDWTDWIDGVTVKVEPVNSSYCKISVTALYLSCIFDSVVLNDKSFTIDEMMLDGTISPQYYHSTGSGHFGTNTISIDFTRYGGVEHRIITNAEKIH